MNVSVTEAKAQLTELVRRAEGGDDVVLTRHGQPVARIVPLMPAIDFAEREAFLLTLQQSAAKHVRPGLSASRSQEFLYDDTGMPG